MTGVRAQLNILVAATTSLVLLAFLVPLGLLLSHSAQERALAAATLQAQSAATLVGLGQAPGAAATGAPVLTVFYPDGHTAGSPSTRTPSIELAARGRALQAESGDGIEVLLPVQGLPSGTAVVRSYAPPDLLQQGVLRTWAVLALLGLVLFGLGLLLADRLGRRLVGSVTALSATADLLAGGDLSARVAPSSTPELRRVGVELNRLAGRIQQLLAAQREEVADLAHRLRTPMTALRLNLDSVHDPSGRDRLADDVDRLDRLVDEVIRTARRPVREGAGAATDLAAVTTQRVAFWSALAEDAGRDVSRRIPAGPIEVRCSAEDLAAALDALLDNVFSHTADGVGLRVTVVAGPTGGGQVTVEDAGAGLPVGSEDRGISAGDSTGLGLDIARRAAVGAGGRMVTGTSSLGGALIVLEFPAPTV